MIDNQVSVEVENLSKKFCRSLKRSLWYGIGDVAAEILCRDNHHSFLRKDEFWSLKDVSFEVRKGETLGVVGHNGAGKSTLLKMINGLVRPDVGSITVHGSIGALIDLGLGFSPILSGRENIYVNAAVLGIPRRDVDRLLDRIIDFAEIGDFIDSPVQTYSSGMRVRLGFSIASNLNPDILLIDEVLSVGDASFRERCNTRLREFKANGGTIFFVSHNANAVEAICDRVILLDHGRIIEIGDPHEVLDRYERQAREISRHAALRLSDLHSANSDGDIVFTSVKCFDLAGTERATFEFGEPLTVRLDFDALESVERPTFHVSFQKGPSSAPFCGMLADELDVERISGRGSVSCTIYNPNFSPGEYEIVVGARKYLSSQFGKKHYAPPQSLGRFEIAPGRFLEKYPATRGSRLTNMTPVVVDHEWRVSMNLASDSDVTRLE